MRGQDEVQRAHDVLAQLVLGEIPGVEVPASDGRALTAALDVLCWVLEHDHNDGFGMNLAAIEEEIAGLGYGLVDLGSPRPRGAGHG